MKKRLIIFALLGANLALAEPLSLDDAIAKAKQKNPQLIASKTHLDKADAQKTSARSLFMPQLTLSGKITKIDDPIEIDLRDMRTAMLGSSYASTYASIYAMTLSQTKNDAASKMTATTVATQGQQQLADQMPEDKFKLKVQDDLFFNATATLIWPIFTGGKIYSAYQAANENVESEKAAYSMVENTVLMEVCTRYFTVRLAEEMVALRTEAYNTIQAHVDQAKKLEEGGQISRAERLRAEVALVEAETEKDNAERDLSLSRLALANTLGESDTALTTTTSLSPKDLTQGLEDYKTRAVSNYPGIKQLEQAKKRSERAVTAARGDFFPTVALFGKKELYTGDLTILEPEWAVGVAVEWNLFHGGETAGKVAEAKATEHEVLSMQNQAVQNISLLVEKRYREYEHAKGRLESLKKTEELAKESLEDQQKAFNAGMGTSLDVVDAQLSLERLRIAMLKANYDATMALAGLLETCGEVEKIKDYLEK